MKTRFVDGVDVKRGSGNVFADLGVHYADKLKIKTGLVIEIRKAMRRLGLTQQEAAKRMGITQPKVSDMMCGDFSNLSLDRGISFEAMVVAVEAGGLIDILALPIPAKYPNQRVLVVAPSRKATRDYLKQGEADAQN